MYSHTLYELYNMAPMVEVVATSHCDTNIRNIAEENTCLLVFCTAV